ncbi:MAG: CPBP family intramembrane metalloprotease [Phycisphaerales bacterium]|nr:CPBP family intramembrane metalloprotease [Phycisphaerales bacterium]
MPRRPAAEPDAYAELSRRPLHVLAFLLPLLAAYEIGSVLFLRDPGTGAAQTIRARALLQDFFEVFGAVGLYLPGALLVVILVTWHVMRRDPWRVRPGVLGGMLVESLLWTTPLLAFAVFMQSLGNSTPAAAAADGLMAMPAGSRLLVSIGAGLYEELLFRLIGITVLHMVLVDVCRVRTLTGSVLAVGLSALAFAMYHDLSSERAGIEWGLAVFYFGSGAYFGGLFLMRGFGVVVAVHALYDALVLVFWHR